MLSSAQSDAALIVLSYAPTHAVYKSAEIFNGLVTRSITQQIRNRLLLPNILRLEGDVRSQLAERSKELRVKSRDQGIWGLILGYT